MNRHPGTLFRSALGQLGFAIAAMVAWGSGPCPADETTHTVAQSASSLRTLDGFQFRAVAQEPLVVDPISARMDSRGRLWVVEMPDYPIGPSEGDAPSGRIKVLEDINDDGVFDRMNLFADGLDFATGIQPYRDGAFVTLAGKIVLMRDLDGDNRCDETITLFRGFAEQNQQLRANHPTLGPDGIIYVSNGLRGGAIEAVDPRYPSRPEPLEIRDRDFAFDPEGGWWGAVAGNSQFGLTIDDFGRRIGCSNRNPAMTPLLSLEAVGRDPLLAPRDAIHNVAAAAENSRVVSRADAWTTSNLHSGQFSAACGVFAPGIEDKSGEWLLVCEPTAYLVQQQRFHRDGSVWMANRTDGEDEFFSSSDTWFRAVDVTAGPSTSVLVVDMARAVIEHPDFVPDELKSRPDQRDGDQLGRIWQIAPQGNWPMVERLESADQAMGWLESTSPWQRQVASQFLLESGSQHHGKLGEIVVAQSASPRARSRAALLLRRFEMLSDDHLHSLATAVDARLRALAVDLYAHHPANLDQTLALCRDIDPLVRRHAAAVVGSSGNAVDQRADALAAAVTTGRTDPWINRTVASVDIGLVAPVAERLANEKRFDAELLAHLTQRLTIDSAELSAKVVARILENRDLNRPMDGDAVTVMEGWLAGNRQSRRNLNTALTSLPSPVQETMTRGFELVAKTAATDSVEPALRARCVTISLAAGFMPDDLQALFAEDSPPEVRIAVVSPLLRRDTDWMRQYLEEHFTAMSIRIREAALAACSSNPDDAKWLLDRIDTGAIPKTIIDPELAARLKKHPDKSIAAKAEKLLQADPDRARVLTEFAGAAQNLGDPLTGKRLFNEHCSACHRIDSVGTNVGPDISDTRTKTADALLVSIPDPNAAIDSAFVQFQVLTVDGRILEGLLIDETANAVTLQQKGGERITVPRDEVEQMQSTGVSLMPEGFERTLDQQAMSHLLSYLKNWRYLKTSIPGTLPDN